MRCVHKLCLLVSSLSEKRQTFKGEGEGNRPLRGTEKSRIEEALALKIDKRVLSDAAEALVVYAWLHDLLTLEDSVEILGKTDSLVEGLTQLLLKVKERIKLSELFPVPY